jgi:asparagine synthase (glutamine-hydrolysing)
MCGIAGIVSSAPFDPQLVEVMASALKHRGPDDEGYATLGNSGRIQCFSGKETDAGVSGLPDIQLAGYTKLALAHRRLSILDLSADGHQPMCPDNGRSALVFNGEIYNYRELREMLKAVGCNFRTESDTEVVLKALETWGESAVSRFRGMWAFAWLDMWRGTLLLSRDRFGIKPLYYTKQGDKIAFASEIKALLQAKVLPARTGRNELFEYLAFGSLSKPFAEPFDNLNAVAPGTNLHVRLSDLYTREDRWYELSQSLRASPSGTAEDFGDWLTESVKLHLRADVPVGACLSGGLDSSAIAAACTLGEGVNPFHTFTAVFPGKSIDEGDYARQVIEALPGVNGHFTTPTAETLLNDLDEMIRFQDLPVGSTSVFAQWEVMKLAGSQGMKVLLDGQGADELLGGYYPFAGLRLINLLKRGHFSTFLREYNQLKIRFTPAIHTAFLRAAYYYLPEGLQRSLRNRERIGSRMIAPAFRREWQAQVPSRGGRDFLDHSLRSLRFGLYELLRYEDRNSMAFSIESRVPFLDHVLAERCLALPESEKMHQGWTKYPVRRYLQGKVPDAVTWRVNKLGFVTPQEEWKSLLTPVLANYLLNYDYPPELDAGYFRQLAHKGVKKPEHLSEFWRAYSVLRWLEVFGVEVS